MLTKECAATDLLINTEQGVPVQENWPIRLVLLETLLLRRPAVFRNQQLHAPADRKFSRLHVLFHLHAVIDRRFNSSAAYWRDMGI